MLVLLLVFTACGSSQKKTTEDKGKRSDGDVVRRFNQIHYYSKVWARTTWLGVPTQQNPCDLWVLQEIISEVKPDYIIETGTLKGGSTLFMAMVLEMVNKNGKIITVDIKPKLGRAKNFVIDRSREKHLLTYYPLGFLKRVK